MTTSRSLLADIAFMAEVIHWRGPAPYYFAAVPDDLVGEVHYAARLASYGWGCVPVEVTARGVDFRTSLFPKDGGYLVPLKVAVRWEAGIGLGDVVEMQVRVFEGPA